VAADGRVGRIIEVEAYGGPPGPSGRPPGDPASHAYRGPTARNRTMFGPAGHLYVYFSYGVHWCANVVTGADGTGSAVLIRALEPLAGLDLMRAARWRTQRRQVDGDLCRGPGRLAQAMGIDGTADSTDLCLGGSPFYLADDGTGPPEMVVSTRVGISAAREVPWRFSVAGHPGLSGRLAVGGRLTGRRPEGGVREPGRPRKENGLPM
jgi:DNA-3-methyladenine glycosylase